MNIKEFLNYSKFFIVESKGYITPWKVRDVLCFPIAYLNFMKLSNNDIKDGFKCL